MPTRRAWIAAEAVGTALFLTTVVGSGLVGELLTGGSVAVDGRGTEHVPARGAQS